MTTQFNITLPAFSRGFHIITEHILAAIGDLPQYGLLHIFIKHTSAGLTINENADPSVRVDFETVFNKLSPEGDPDLTHTMEGPDDMPAHIKAALVGHSVQIPITDHRLNLGTWQGVYLCEFRNHGGNRQLVATIIT
jgi:secondary thiamine-phosphate synthase enzyme